jgi:UDP-N-acetylglucosamine pyrophosphorylase
MREIKKYEKALERLYRDNIIIDVYNIDNLISYCNLHNISFIIGKNIHLKKD